ncbi:hypothetical protein HPB47_010867, partial [Ixodes persulcatus]
RAHGQYNPNIRIGSLLDLAHALKEFDRLKLCTGGPKRKEYPQVQPGCAFVDVREVWQHNRCTLVTSAGEQCPACHSLLNTLRIQAARQQNKGANSSELRLLTFSPAKRKAEQLKKARQSERFRGGPGPHGPPPPWLRACFTSSTPTGYQFLRDNDLPLPSMNTIPKYISMVHLKCGFDQDFSLALKIKLQQKTDFKRHGGSHF